MPRPTGIDAAWEVLFQRHSILERIAAEGSFSISSAEINKVKEARLMAKFDRSAQLPKIFRAHRLSILPVSRGGYLIAPFRTHRAVEYGAVRPRVLPAPDLETLDGTNLYSEGGLPPLLLQRRGLSRPAEQSLGSLHGERPHGLGGL